MSTIATSYQYSHASPTKGDEYERYYETNEWQRYISIREQHVLEDVLATQFTGRNVDLLDFACGTGRITRFLEDRVTTATGVDVSGAMLSVAREKVHRAKLLQADITESGALSGRRFDLITAFRFFTNAEPDLRKKVMPHLANLLKDDGLLVFNNHQNAWSPYPLVSFLRHRLRQKDGVTYRVMSPLGMRRLCANAGLTVVRSYGLGLFHVPMLKPSISVNQLAEKLGRRLSPLRLFAQDIVMVCRRA